MKRDMDLVRELLLRLEALPIRRGGIVHIPATADEISVPGHDVAEIEYHLSQLVKAGFIDEGGLRPSEGIGFRSLTWEGHDFLDSVRDPKVWAKTKSGALAAGGFTVDLLKDLAKGFVKKQIEERTGVQL